MALLDDARQLTQRPGPTCSVLRLEADNPKLFAEVADAIRDRSVTASAIGRVCASDRYKIDDITAHTVSRHRNNLCSSCKQRGITW
jgi:hypothetical protein